MQSVSDQSPRFKREDKENILNLNPNRCKLIPVHWPRCLEKYCRSSASDVFLLLDGVDDKEQGNWGGVEVWCAYSKYEVLVRVCSMMIPKSHSIT